MKEALIELFTWKDDMQYMAVDEDGGVYQYSKEPHQNDGGEWDIKDYSNAYEKVGFVSPPQDWTTTLVKREEWKLSEAQLQELCGIAPKYIYGVDLISQEGILEIIATYESFKPKA